MGLLRSLDERQGNQLRFAGVPGRGNKLMFITYLLHIMQHSKHFVINLILRTTLLVGTITIHLLQTHNF